MFNKENDIEKVNEWASFSLVPHTNDEIREQVLRTEGNVCWSYICVKSKLSEDFILELAAISTGFVREKTYDEDLALVEEELMYKYKISNHPADSSKIENLILKVRKNPKPDGDLMRKWRQYEINDRLDWKAIFEKPNLSEKFKEKFKHADIVAYRAHVKRYRDLVALRNR